MTDYLCEGGIIKDRPILSWQYLAVNFLHVLLDHSLDSMLSAGEARAVFCPVLLHLEKTPYGGSLMFIIFFEVVWGAEVV